MDTLAGCVVMLSRDYTETTSVDGQEHEVWLKAPGARRATPKLNRHLGSAFLVAAGRATVLVTAAHVAQRMDANARMSYRAGSAARATVELGDVASRRGLRLPWRYQGHADVAVLRLRRLPAGLQGQRLPHDRVRRAVAAPPGVDRLLVMGFPLGLFPERDFAPVVKRAHAASGFVRFYSEQLGGPAVYFFIDEPAMGGYSGGPVFTTPEVSLAEPHCVGLVSQTISDEAGGRLTAIVPSYVIRRAVVRVVGRR